ncbi:MAG: rhomboid family intramembrane serine protease [Desulfohalobiaceae bacterium]
MEDVTREARSRLGMEQVGQERIRDWILVLSALRIPFTIRQEGTGHWALLVDFKDKEKALEQILAYEQENQEQTASFQATGAQGRLEPSIWILLSILLFYRLTQVQSGIIWETEIPWQELGRLEVLAVQKGQWWRLVTALTLHADLPHVLGNICIGGIFIIQLCRSVGSGLGWFLVLLSGILGNLSNFFVQDSTHVSLGGSTAVFGAVGLLAGLRSLQGADQDLRRELLPLAAGLGLLALLGLGSNQNIDVWAHIMGFFWGGTLGLVLGQSMSKGGWPRPAWDAPLGLAALFIVFFSWWQALQGYL